MTARCCRGSSSGASSSSAATGGSTATGAFASGTDVLVALRAVVLATGSRATDPSDSRARRGATVDECRGDDREGGAGPARHPRRRGGRGRAGTSLVGTRIAGDARPAGAVPDRAGGAVRRRAGGSRAAGSGRRRPARRDRRRGDAERRRSGSSSTTAPIVEADELLVAIGRTPRSDGRRPRDGWARARRARTGRRVAARARARLALRDRRRQRARAVHAHGEVPGTAGGGRDPRQRRAPALRRWALAARDLHRPPGRRRRADPRSGAGGRLARARTWTSRRAATPAAASSARAHRGRRGSSSTRTMASSSARRSPVPRSRRRFTRRRSPSSAEVPLDDLWHSVPAFPTRSELWLRLLEAYGL